MSTIYALSTVAGKSAVAVIRVSGPHARTVLQTLAGSKTAIVERQAQVRSLRHPKTRDLLDRALTIYTSGPKTFTGEDTCELHLHGGKAVIGAVLEAIPTCHESIRYALAGEFSKRSFYNGKMDLTQAEGLADLINAETDEQRRSAFRQSDGELSKLYEGWRDELIKLRGSLEAIIDFGEDNDDVEGPIMQTVFEQASSLFVRIEQHLKSSMKGELLREGIRVAIFGPPNAGKSSLLNKLAQREASIVSPEAGTTRDVIEKVLDIGGFPVIIGDTAGLRTGSEVGLVEQEGVRRARKLVQEADLRICVLAHGETLDATTLEVLNSLAGEPDKATNTVLLINKSDLSPSNALSVEQLVQETGISAKDIFPVSCLTNEGMEQLLQALVKRFQSMTSEEVGERQGQQAFATNARHRAQVSKCLDYLKLYLDNWAKSETEGVVFGAEELRYASDSLGRVTGKIDVEEILGQIFSSFCIGK